MSLSESNEGKPLKKGKDGAISIVAPSALVALVVLGLLVS